MTKIRSLTLAAIFWFVAATPASSQTKLDIEPVFQQTAVWCWTTVGEMVFTYFGVENINPVGNFQCGIVALLAPACNQNCGNCVVPAGSLSTMRNMITQYPDVASRLTRTSTHLSASTMSSALSMSAIQREIDAGRPIIAGISPSGNSMPGGSEHVALIIGYDDDNIIVNDPYPFDATFSINPYIAADGDEIDTGQYSIKKSRFESLLKWRETIYRIRCSGANCAESGSGSSESYSEHSEPIIERPQFGRSCQTNVGRCGPFPTQPALPLGSACWCQTPYGPADGVVVRP